MNHLLKRAALLHTDIAMLMGADDRVRPPGSGTTFTQRFADGERTAASRGDTHWKAARDLLRLVLREDAPRRKTVILDARADADVHAWYTATLAWKASRDLIDLPHVNDGLTTSTCATTAWHRRSRSSALMKRR